MDFFEMYKNKILCSYSTEKRVIKKKLKLYNN